MTQLGNKPSKYTVKTKRNNFVSFVAEKVDLACSNRSQVGYAKI